MEEKKFNTLYSISYWDQDNWLRWKTLAIPTKQKSQWEILKVHLAGVAPIKKEEQGDFVWDTNRGDYTMKYRYNLLQKHHRQHDWNLWKTAWKTE